MRMYLIKWTIAGLIWPALYLASYSFISWSEEWVLLLWPSSFVLMSLGTGPNEAMYIAYVWSIGILLNVITYLVVGLLIRLVISVKHKTERENS